MPQSAIPSIACQDRHRLNIYSDDVFVIYLLVLHTTKDTESEYCDCSDQVHLEIKTPPCWIAFLSCNQAYTAFAKLRLGVLWKEAFCLELVQAQL